MIKTVDFSRQSFRLTDCPFVTASARGIARRDNIEQTTPLRIAITNRLNIEVSKRVRKGILPENYGK
jgi:hypothetical protein